MELKLIDGRTLAVERDSLVVCMPVTSADARTIASAHGAIEHSAPSAAVMLVGPEAVLAGIQQELATRSSGVSIALLPVQELHVAKLCSRAIEATAPADVVLLAPGIDLTPGWLERLHAAACSDSTVASATPLCLGSAAIELLPEKPTDLHLLDAARRVAEGSLKLRPKIVTVGPACCYLRRPALALAGPLDDELGLEGALARLGVRLTSLGMVNVLADDVLVAGDVEARTPDASDTSMRSSSERLISETLNLDERGALQRAIEWARAELRRVSVTIDARALEAAAGGTQTYIIELILALAREPDVSVRVLVPPILSERAAQALASVPELERLTYEEAIESPPLTDVVHRPQQVFTLDDLALLRLVARRVVIGQQDMIAYHNHSYHADVYAWRAYRRTTRLALAGADQAIFFSEHARHDALAEDLLAPARTHVAGLGAETLQPAHGDVRPDGLGDVPFLLCLGADYAHKNRPFAIRLIGALRSLGWDGRLVLAGSHVPHGSSQAEEQALLVKRPDLAELVVDLGLIGEPQRGWLFANAQALLYPTLYEGFGLLPPEAARVGLPCLFARQASLAELAGDAATLIPWDPELSARAVLPLLSDGPAREHHLEQLRSLFPTWREVATRLAGVYRHALASPPAEAAPRVWQELDREQYIIKLDEDINTLKRIAEEYQIAYNSLEARVAAGLPLIDDGGLLSHEQQRGLMRVASRRAGAIVLGPLGLLGRAGRRRG